MDNFEVRKSIVKRFPDAVKAHNRALSDLTLALKTFTRSLDALVSSLNVLARDSERASAISLGGALHRGLVEVQESTYFDDLEDEVEFSLQKRFQGINEVHKELDVSRKHRSTVKKELDALDHQVAKLLTKSDRGDKEMDEYKAAVSRQYTLNTEFKRLCSEFDDCFMRFTADLGEAVLTDMREFTGVIHGVLSSVSYQFRKCNENLNLATPLKVSGRTPVGTPLRM